MNAKKQFLLLARSVVAENLGNSKFTVDDLSTALNLSRSQLYRKLKALTGRSASDFIRYQKLEAAAVMLDHQAGSITEIAYKVGFNNLSYFSKCFKKQFGCQPSEFANREK